MFSVENYKELLFQTIIVYKRIESNVRSTLLYNIIPVYNLLLITSNNMYWNYMEVIVHFSEIIKVKYWILDHHKLKYIFFKYLKINT